MTWEKRMFNIANTEEKSSRQGWVWGTFGIDRRANGYAVTNLPTGYRVCPWQFESLDDAKAFCHEADALTDWASIDPKTSKRMLHMGPCLRKIASRFNRYRIHADGLVEWQEADPSAGNHRTNNPVSGGRP